MKIGAMTVYRPSSEQYFSCPPTDGSETGVERSPIDVSPETLGINLDLMEALLTDDAAGFAYVDLEFRFIRLNKILSKIYEKDDEDLIGLHVSRLVGNANWELVKPFLVLAAGGATVHDVHACSDRPDSEGRLHQRVTSFFPVSVNGTVVGIAAVVHDITDRVNAERAVRESEARYRLLAESIPHHVWVIDSDGQFQYVNDRLQDYVGDTLDSINRKGWASYVAPEHRASASKTWNRAREAGVPFEIECKIRSFDGGYRWFLVRGLPIYDDKTGALRWLGTCTDMHAQKIADEKKTFLVELGERLRSTHTPDELLAQAVTSLGEHLHVSRCGYWENDWDRQVITKRQEYHAPGAPAAADEYPRSSLSKAATEQLKSGVSVTYDDTETDPRTAPTVEFYSGVHMRAAIIVPIVREGVYTACLTAIMSDQPRHWQDHEISLVKAVAERTWLALENARLYHEKRQAEEKQRAFVRDVLSIVTDGRLTLCETPADLPEEQPRVGEVIKLTEADGLRRLRHAVRDLACRLGFDDLRTGDVMTAVAEAAMNAVVHAVDGRGWICTDWTTKIQAWVVDRGSGISTEKLPHATLVRGYSTASTLGHGFKMMIGSTDLIYLLTNETGTTVVIEQPIASAPEPGKSPLV